MDSDSSDAVRRYYRKVDVLSGLPLLTGLLTFAIMDAAGAGLVDIAINSLLAMLLVAAAVSVVIIRV